MILRRIPIRNVTRNELRVLVEPWGEQHILKEDELLEVVFHGPAGGKPELHVGESEIFVYGWQESSVFVLKNNLCLSQPSLLEIIERLSASGMLDKSRLELEPELIEFAQYQLDKAESWDEAGREAAINAISKVVPSLRKFNNDTFIWQFCQYVLHSRGVFLRENDYKHREFLRAINDSGDFLAILTQWQKCSEQDSELSDATEPR